MAIDPVYEWPIDIVDGQVICAAPRTPVPDSRFKLGVRTDDCGMVIARFFTIHEMMEELRTHIANVMHALQVDWGDLVNNYEVAPPLPVYFPSGGGSGGGGGGGVTVTPGMGYTFTPPPVTYSTSGTTAPVTDWTIVTGPLEWATTVTWTE